MNEFEADIEHWALTYLLLFGGEFLGVWVEGEMAFFDDIITRYRIQKCTRWDLWLRIKRRIEAWAREQNTRRQDT